MNQADLAVPGRTLVIANVRLIDGLGGPPREEGALAVRAGTIAAVGPADGMPRADAVLDGGGRTLLPGLIDAHAHLIYSGSIRARGASRTSTRPRSRRRRSTRSSMPERCCGRATRPCATSAQSGTLRSRCARRLRPARCPARRWSRPARSCARPAASATRCRRTGAVRTGSGRSSTDRTRSAARCGARSGPASTTLSSRPRGSRSGLTPTPG